MSDATRPQIAATTGERVTHGRHCPCSACAREDWSRITGPCGMHGEGCPAVYAPLSFGASGTEPAYSFGLAVTWRYETRGGWGYIWHVPAYVVKTTAKRVGIAALYGDGETWVPRWVKPESLRLGHPGLSGVLS